MDEENINTSFINLFDCDGWIITKNGKGKIQAAFCEQDETNIYEKTRHWKIQQTDHTKTDSFNLPPSEIGKTARFFLRDILDSDKKDNYFICYDIPYVNVFVCGTVISFFERYRKYSVIIDDGTSSIKCIVQKEILNFKKEFCSSDTNDHHFAEIFKEDKDNTFLQAASITRQATRNLISQVPTFEELELGDFRQHLQRCFRLINCIHTERETKIGVLGVPFDKGQPRVGVANGPDAIRKAGLIEQLASIHRKVNIKDYGNVTYEVNKEIDKHVPNMREYAHIACCNHELSKSVEGIIKEGRICLTLGGDHSIGVGTVDGHIKAKNEEVCVLWVDAHADLNTNKTSASGNVHGMPMALLASELSDYWPYLPGMDWQKPVISIRNVAYIGLRSVDSYERLVIDKLGITAFGMEEIENYGIATVVNMALNKLDPEGKRSIHVSFDIDSLDALEAPSTGIPIRGGLTLREGIHVMESVYKTGRLGAMDLVEVNPSIGTEQDVKRTVDAAIHIILSAFGYSRKGLIPKDAQLPLQTFPPTRQVIQ
ncbi:hypothetical protein NQ317_004170 [Molorchus minor]|uniref:Arginase n=1 Tax=Molorchus minor TaxID=1323400 RepID=A0ABQ9JSK7_9CUCU|nr:hypothetical protein NQ317_004170 [Molorchus minor]